MKSTSRTSAWVVILLAACSTAATARVDADLFFLHHSTGAGIIAEGAVRDEIAAYNAANETQHRFWDHDYNTIGLTDPDGVSLGYSYEIPDDNTDPDGLHVLWTTDNSARDSILANHDVIAFKSCFPASAIGDAAQLAQYKTWYLEMRDVFDQHTDKIFVVVSPPPLHRLATVVEEADRARAFADWLGSAEYLGGRDHVVCFDLFDLLAHTDDGSETRNMLRHEYELDHFGDDSHPNTLANETIGPIFAETMCEWGNEATPHTSETWGGIKGRFRE